ncbi:homeobox protein 4 [Octopus bimaculoides]|uniref:Uncharacterized protein n=1 Tax=Octopus bimaculoides TaxID=37653 RepID=A0A0L8HD15_OCTBM|nr:homeobox protein 4 [Octopus bimaculoides]XP_014773719.1 homeobox protein 4 [Octopus bimaculoides]|eukprot:XP_014773718.1 PREDICTED: homeobox protein 4-like [Octopus bimaculoides]
MLKWKNKSFKPSSFSPENVKNKDTSTNIKPVNSIFKISTFKKNPIKVTTFNDKDNYTEINCNTMEATNGFLLMGRNEPNDLEKIPNKANNDSSDHPNNFISFDPEPLDHKVRDNPLYQTHTLFAKPSDTSTTEYHDVLDSLQSNDGQIGDISQNVGVLSLNGDQKTIVQHTDRLYESINQKVYDNNIDGLNKESKLLTNNRMTVAATVEPDYLSRRNLLNSNLMDNEYEEIYIPEPDYDEDEVTLNFKNEDFGNTDSQENSPRQLFKNYEGEDFGKYLSDEEDFVDTNGYTWRKNIQYHTISPASQKANTEIKRNRPKTTKTAQAMFKSAPKIKGNIIRHNLRDFSYADTKISVKPSNAKPESRYQKKQEKFTDDDDFMRTKNSYEKFLSTRLVNDNRGTQWTAKELETRFNENQAESKPPKRTKNGNNTIVGRLTSKLRPKSDTNYYMSTSINS